MRWIFTAAHELGHLLLHLGAYDVAKLPAFNPAGIIAWAAGFVVYKIAAPIGATLPALATSMLIYALLARAGLGIRVVVVTQNSH